MPEPPSKRTLRVMWLHSHPEITSLTRRQLFDRMVKEGCISSKTNLCDVNFFRLLCTAGYSDKVCERFSGAYDAT